MNVAPVLAALGDESRLRIVTKLCKNGPLSATKLAAGEGISRQAVTKHLYALRKAALVRSQRRGRERLWALDPKRINEVRRYLARISAQWDEAIGRLKHMVED